MNKTSVNAAIHRRYTIELLTAMTAYVVLLLLSVYLLRTRTFAQPWLSLAAVFPAIPLFFVMRSVVRLLNRIDELQRRIHLEALAFAAGATAMVDGFPRVSAFWAFVSVDVFWALSLPFVTRRYK